MSTFIQRSKSRTAVWGMAIIGIAILGASLTRASGTGPTGGEPARICVVDLERIFDSAPQRVAMEESLMKRDAEIRTIADAAKKELDRLKGELELVQAGSDEHQRIRREMVSKQEDLRFQSEKWEKEMESRVLEARGNLLKEIEAVVQRVCDTEGFDIVLQREFKIPKTQVVWNTAFFARPQFDLTDRVIAGLK